MNAFMYILRCANGQYYTGSTLDLDRRVAEHSEGEGANFTKRHLPVELVYFEQYYDIKDAFEREKQVQGWGRKKKESRINGNYDNLPKLAECQNKSHYKNAEDRRKDST